MSAPPNIQLPFSNDGSFMEQFLKMQRGQQQAEPQAELENTTSLKDAEQQQVDQQPASANTAATAQTSTSGNSSGTADRPPSSPDNSSAGVGASFIASSTFTGAKPGYVFKTDSNGTGYYLDTKEALQPPKPKPKPVVLKSNNPIVKVPSKTPTAAESRKRKAEDDGKPRYLRELDKYKSMACGSDTKHDRPLVK